MSASRGLGLWRLARSIPRVAFLAKPNRAVYTAVAATTRRRAVTTINAPPTYTTAYSGLRLLSTHSSSDPPPHSTGQDSTSHLGRESDPGTPEREASADESGSTSDPELTSDQEIESDHKTSSEPTMTPDSESEATSDPESTSDPDEARSNVLDAALDHVPALGWTVAALEEGARAVGMTEPIGELFPRGGGELIDHFERQCNSDLVEFMQKKAQQDGVKGTELMEEAVEHRLRMIVPFINKWPQAMAVKAFPSNVPTALENLALMVDDIWYYSGDRSTDINWYTKRALLATIYSSTEVFLVQDTSLDFQETWRFLRRRLEDARNFGKASKEFQGMVSGGMETLTAGLKSTMKVLGLIR